VSNIFNEERQYIQWSDLSTKLFLIIIPTQLSLITCVGVQPLWAKNTHDPGAIYPQGRDSYDWILRLLEL